MKNRIIFISAILLNIALLANGQEQKKLSELIRFEFHGFIKTDFWYDTRQVVDAREDLFALYPEPVLLDKDGIDINDKSSFNYSAITTRANVSIYGPNAFGAYTIGFIEADFSGVNNAGINTFRLRHAYIELNWTKTELLLGQFWHPMFVTDVFPTVISLNTGAPFQPFIRNPQIRLTYSNHNFHFIGALLSQRDYANSGPIGRNPVYLSNSSIPNAHIQIKYKTDKFIAGLAADYKILQPRLMTDSFYKTNARVSSLAYMAYFRFNHNNFKLMAKTIYGQNLTEHSMIGGYAIHSRDETTNIETYTPSSTIASWIHLVYGTKIQAGLFAGYTKNLGTLEENIGIYYSRGHDIDYVYRLAPSISYIWNKTQISLEFEYTTASYGTPGLDGKINNSVPVSNFRTLLTAFYFF